MKYYQKMVQAFWKQWQKEYLTNLREQHASHKNKPKSEETVAKGMVVLIHDDTPRNQWKLGVIYYSCIEEKMDLYVLSLLEQEEEIRYHDRSKNSIHLKYQQKKHNWKNHN